MFPRNRFPLWEIGGASASPLFFIYKLLVLFTLFFMIGCATPEVEVGQVTIVIKEPIKTANKGER
jgi:hypothetical protein